MLVAVSGRSPMAGPPAVPRVGVAVSGLDVLLATKLHIQPGDGHPNPGHRRRASHR